MSLAATAAQTQTPQETIDRDVLWKIRSEAAERSQILNTLHMLTDVYGPRLTGSPNLKAASDWVVKRTTDGASRTRISSRGTSAVRVGSTSARPRF